MISCGSKVSKEDLTAEEAFHRALKEFDRGKYLNAVDQLTLVTFNYSGSAIIDSAQYYLAESHFKMKEYLLAAAEYERLSNHFPYSPLVDDARYKIGMCYYELSPKYPLDQEYTYQAIEQFQRFTEDYPDSPLLPEVLDKIHKSRAKLARKTFKSGELYFKMKDYPSVVIYMDEVLDFYYDTEFAPRALLFKGDSYQRMKRFSEAEEVYRKLIEKYPKSREAETAVFNLSDMAEIEAEAEREESE
ncbi:MAG: outer membrane protein assembly factor BamD [FCB group bacterium]|nr:outer membrane protein assembly factor BamD [FCB group bacterium]